MKQQSRLFIRFSLVLVLAVLITFIYYKLTFDSTLPNAYPYRDLAAIFTAIIVSGSLLVNAINADINAWANTEKINLDREKLSFDKAKYDQDKKVMVYQMMDAYNTSFMRDLTLKAVLFVKANKELLQNDKVDFANKLDNSLEDRMAVSGVLNMLERVALAYKENLANRELIEEYFRDIFIMHYGTFSEYITIRNMRAKSKNNNIFDTFVSVAKEWEAKYKT